MDGIITGSTFVLYIVSLLGVGFWASRRTHSESDFLLGGRLLGPWVAGLSYAASTSSGWVFIGFTGFVYVEGLSALWIVPGIWMGYVGVWLLLGPSVRDRAARENLVTATDLIASGSEGGARRAIIVSASIFIIFCFTFYIAAQFQAAGVAFGSTFDVDVRLAVLVGAAIILFYCAAGGFWAVSVTDMLQGAVVAFAATVLPVVALVEGGGFSGIVATLQQSAPEGYLSLRGNHTWFIFAGFLLGLWGVGINQLGQPHLLARLMAVKDEASRRRGFIVTLAWGLVVFIGTSVLAVSSRALVLQIDDPEAIFTVMTETLFPPVLAGLILAAVLSAVMSTVDSLLLVCAGAISHDLGVAHRVPGRELLISRVVMIVIALVAVALTLNAPESVFSRVLFAWAALGATFGPVLVVRRLGGQPHPWAVWTAMTVGFLVTVLFNQVEALPAGPGVIGERLVPWLPAVAILLLFRVRPEQRRTSLEAVEDRG